MRTKIGYAAWSIALTWATACHLTASVQAQHVPEGIELLNPQYPKILKTAESVGSQDVVWTQASSKLSVEDLRIGQIAWREKIRSIRVKFDYQYDRKFDAAVDLESKKKGLLVPKDLNFTFEYAGKGVKSACRYLSSEKIEYNKYFNGTDTKSFQPQDTFGAVAPGNTKDMDKNFSFYNDCVGLDIPSKQEAISTNMYIPSIIEGKEFRVFDRLCSVDNNPCHVVTDGFDTIWMDARAGYCMRRRVRIPRQRPGAQLSGSPDWVMCAKDFVELEPGVFLPRFCQSYVFTDQTDTPSTRNRVRAVSTTKVVKISINDVTDEDCDFQFPPGTHVFDKSHKKIYVIPHGEHNLEKVIEQGKDILSQSNPPETAAGLNWITITMMLAPLALIIIYVTYPAWKNRR